MRADDSPISVAFEDAVLRAEGLSDDTYGEATRFFDLSNRELHNIVCYCHLGRTMTAETAALRVSSIAKSGSAPRDRCCSGLAGADRVKLATLPLT